MAKGLADWLEEQGEDVIYKEDKITMEEIKELSPDFIISYNYKYIISKEIIDCVGVRQSISIVLFAMEQRLSPKYLEFS